MADLKVLGSQFREVSKLTWMKVYPNKQTPHIWHISFKGATETFFENGIYHIQINLSGYPSGAPSIRMMTKSGAYQENVDLCILGITSYHPEAWSPTTSIESIVHGIINYMSIPTDRVGLGMIHALKETECKRLALESVNFKCGCGADHSTLFK